MAMTNRRYKISDSKLLQHTGIILAYLETELPAFTALDADLNTSLVQSLEKSYEDMLAEGGDDLARDKVGEKTEDLSEEVRQTDTVMMELRYWVNKRYKDNPEIITQFQLSTYWKVRNRPAELVVYLKTLGSILKERKTELTASNVPSSLLLKVGTQTQALATALHAKELSKSKRQADTQQRVIKLNMIYGVCLQFWKAAKLVYKAEVARRNQYRLPRTRKVVRQKKTV